MAKAENGEIYWGDETGIQNTADYLRGYAPIGQTPVVQKESQKFKANLLSVISNRGEVRFIIYEMLSPDTMIDFMHRLVSDTKRKVFCFCFSRLSYHR